ncbi:MAG TPA: hypothetical protein VME86_13085, partial [Acidobacteriaceae bacterium]|nr:hypothetical protein [Acidobacteriaceae bacterium]
MSDFKITRGDLHHLPELLNRLDARGEPSFLAVVALSGVVLICVFLGALLIVGASGTRILPDIHRPDYEPTSMLVMSVPAQPTVS